MLTKAEFVRRMMDEQKRRNIAQQKREIDYQEYLGDRDARWRTGRFRKREVRR